MDEGFFSYMFRFDDVVKGDLLNIAQYCVLAIVPIVALNKLNNRYVPDVDESKSSFEIGVEVVLQTVVIFVGLFFIHRAILYFPTYSKTDYPEFSIISVVGATLLILMSLQTKLGEKVSILYDRVLEFMGVQQPVSKKQQDQLPYLEQPQPPKPPQHTIPPSGDIFAQTTEYTPYSAKSASTSFMPYNS